MTTGQPRPTRPPEPDENGDYDCPALVALRRVWNDYCEEIASPEQVMDTISEIGRFCQHNLGLLEKQVEDGVSNPEDPAFSLILEAFEMMLEACEYLALEFVEPDPEDEVEEPEEGFFMLGIELVQEATNQMMEGHNLALDHIQAISEVNCLFCSQKNSRESQRCSKCGRTLPNSVNPAGGSSFEAVNTEGLDKSGSEPQGEFTRNYVTVAQTISGWQSGHISPEQLLEVLDAVEEALAAHLEDTERQESQLRQAPQAQQQALLQAVALTQEGLEASLAGLERMRDALEREDETQLSLAMSEFESASRQMVASYHACKQAAASGAS